MDRLWLKQAAVGGLYIIDEAVLFKCRVIELIDHFEAQQLNILQPDGLFYFLVIYEKPLGVALYFVALMHE